MNLLNKNCRKISKKCFKCFAVVALTHIWRHNAHRTFVNKNPDFLTQKVQRPRYVDWKYFTYLENGGIAHQRLGVDFEVYYGLCIKFQIDLLQNILNGNDLNNCKLTSTQRVAWNTKYVCTHSNCFITSIPVFKWGYRK